MQTPEILNIFYYFNASTASIFGGFVKGTGGGSLLDGGRRRSDQVWGSLQQQGLTPVARQPTAALA